MSYLKRLCRKPLASAGAAMRIDSPLVDLDPRPTVAGLETMDTGGEPGALVQREMMDEEGEEEVQRKVATPGAGETIRRFAAPPANTSASVAAPSAVAPSSASVPSGAQPRAAVPSRPASDPAVAPSVTSAESFNHQGFAGPATVRADAAPADGLDYQGLIEPAGSGEEQRAVHEPTDFGMQDAASHSATSDNRESVDFLASLVASIAEENRTIAEHNHSLIHQEPEITPVSMPAAPSPVVDSGGGHDGLVIDQLTVEIVQESVPPKQPPRAPQARSRPSAQTSNPVRSARLRFGLGQL